MYSLLSLKFTTMTDATNRPIAAIRWIRMLHICINQKHLPMVRSIETQMITIYIAEMVVQAKGVHASSSLKYSTYTFFFQVSNLGNIKHFQSYSLINPYTKYKSTELTLCPFYMSLSDHARISVDNHHEQTDIAPDECCQGIFQDSMQGLLPVNSNIHLFRY